MAPAMRSSGRATPARCAAIATPPSGSVPKSANKYKTFNLDSRQIPKRIRESDKVVLEGRTAQQRSLSRDEVIEDTVENEENRNVENDVQQDPEGGTRQRG